LTQSRGVEYQATVSNLESKNIILGNFKTPEDAFNCYKYNKELLAKDLAREFADQIDVKSYNALLNYTVNYED
jgi:hypothetical protein